MLSVSPLLWGTPRSAMQRQEPQVVSSTTNYEVSQAQLLPKHLPTKQVVGSRRRKWRCTSRSSLARGYGSTGATCLLFSGSLPPLCSYRSGFNAKRGKFPFYCWKHRCSAACLISNLRVPCVQAKGLQCCCKNPPYSPVFFLSSSVLSWGGIEVGL